LRRPRGDRVRVVALGGLALALIALPQPSRAQQGLPSELQQIERIRFEGRRHVPAKELRSVMKTQTPSVLPWRDRPVLRLDFVRADTVAIINVYRQHGYLDADATARIRTRAGGTQAELTFVIREGAQSHVRAVEFTGVHAMPETPLRQKIYTRQGRPFNPSALVVDTLRIAEVYQDRGYRPRVVADTSRRENEITVRYTISEGPLYHFGQVYYSSPGPLGVQRSLIERMLDVHTGEIYRTSRIQRSVEHLYATDLFRSIQVTPLPDSTNSLIEISMRLEERKRRWIDAGIGSGTSERFSLNGSWGHRNLGGRGIAGILGSRLSLDKDAKFLLWRTEASLQTPLLLGVRASGQATAYYQQSDDRVTGFDSLVIHQRAPGVRFQVQREFSRILKLTATQDNIYVEQSVGFLKALSDSVQQSILATFPSRYNTHLVNLALDRDARDDPLTPTRGSAQSVSGEIAGGPLKGSSSYSKGQIASAWYTPLPQLRVLALQVRAGLARPFGKAVEFSPADTLVSAEVARVPIANRFRIGGVNSVRGFAENSLAPEGGLAMVQVNAELRVPVVGPFGVEFYIDGGNVWPTAGDIHLSDLRPRIGGTPVKPGEMRYVYGLGPRLNLPFGPLRLDITWSQRRIGSDGKRFLGKLQFAIGPSF
jgi:outer membrane protein assembly complex protein YaeT